MKKISFTLLALIAIFTASAQHRSTFDDLGLPADSFWNGSNLSGGFLDGDAYFTNDYDPTYQAWSGFAYSNQPINVDTLYASAYDSSNDYYYQYNCAAGSGVYGSSTFGICYTGGNPTLRLAGFAPHHEVYGFYVTNSAYDYVSMKYGDDFAKKFGGVTGTDPDWFLLSVTGWYQGTPISDTVSFYLADFRSPDTTQHYIVNSWQFVNLLPLGNVDSLTFLLNSSDTAGGFGMNTPAYFDMDNFMTTDGATYYPPIAEDDSFKFQYMDTLTGNADTLIGNILVNDTLSSFLQYTVSLVTGPSILGAYAYLNANDSLVYIPAAGIEATDTLAYSVCDEVGNCDTAQIFVTILGPNDTGIKGLAYSELHVYPNPASTLVSISYSAEMESVSVVDVAGRQVMQQKVNSDNFVLNIEALSPGSYTILVHTADGMAARSIVKN